LFAWVRGAAASSAELKEILGLAARLFDGAIQSKVEKMMRRY
jgi:hypothetical protein